MVRSSYGAGRARKSQAQEPFTIGELTWQLVITALPKKTYCATWVVINRGRTDARVRFTKSYVTKQGGKESAKGLIELKAGEKTTDDCQRSAAALTDIFSGQAPILGRIVDVEVEALNTVWEPGAPAAKAAEPQAPPAPAPASAPSAAAAPLHPRLNDPTEPMVPLPSPKVLLATKEQKAPKTEPDKDEGKRADAERPAEPRAESRPTALAQVGDRENQSSLPEGDPPWRGKYLRGELFVSAGPDLGMYLSSFGYGGHARLDLNSYFWHQDRRYGWQLNARATYSYLTTMDLPRSADSHLFDMDLMALFRVRNAGIGLVGGVRYAGGPHEPAFGGSFGPAISFHKAQLTGRTNLQFILSWRPIGRSPVDMSVDFRVGTRYFGYSLSANLLSLQQADMPDIMSQNNLIFVLANSIGFRIPW